LISHIYARFSPAVSQVIISGASDYGLNLPFAPDREGPVAGPLAGLLAGSLWVLENTPEAEFFATVPVDCPFFPENLVETLSKNAPAYAVSGGREHPVFGVWPTALETPLLAYASKAQNPCLMGLLDALGANPVEFPDETAFFNINDPEDLKIAENLNNATLN